MRPPVRLLVIACAAVLAPAAAAAGVAKNPENDKRLGPGDTPGYFTGFPSPTYAYHGCTLTSRARTAVTRPPGMPAFGKGTKQGAVSFQVQAAQPFVSWKARAGYRVCGVQISTILSSPDDDVRRLGGAGYASGPTKGATAASGKETIKIRVSKKDAHPDIARTMGGKTYSIGEILDVTVYVKRKG